MLAQGSYCSSDGRLVYVFQYVFQFNKLGYDDDDDDVTHSGLAYVADCS